MYSYSALIRTTAAVTSSDIATVNAAGSDAYEQIQGLIDTEMRLYYMEKDGFSSDVMNTGKQVWQRCLGN